MLRRKPTAITITSEDISAFEEIHDLHLEALKKRGKNKTTSHANNPKPHHPTTSTTSSAAKTDGNNDELDIDIDDDEDAEATNAADQEMIAEASDAAHHHQHHNGSGSGSGAAASGSDMMMDPSDELRPLPGDKARIVRTRDERIMGGGRRRP